MKYWLDTEFIEDGRTIDLISIGIAAEDGRKYYAINQDCDFSKASDWVNDNVLRPIGLSRSVGADINPSTASPNTRNSYLQMKPKSLIAAHVVEFVGGEMVPQGYPPLDKVQYRLKEGVEKPDIWGYYADYDWVAFCQLFGTMMDLPKGFPMYCRDIKQWADILGNPLLPEQKEGEHNALADALWNKLAWQFLSDLEAGKP